MLFLAIDFSDFKKYKVGGTLSFDKNLTKIFSPEEMGIVGYVDNNEPVGKWFKRRINNKEYNYFGICTISEIKNSKIPDRLFSLIMLARYINRIRSQKVKRIFTQSPHFVFILSFYKWDHFCFYFAGLGNSIALSKYKYFRWLGGVYEFLLFKLLKKKADVVLAASDKRSIEKKMYKYHWKNKRIISFPTRYDNTIFYPMNKKNIRQKLNIPKDIVILIATGRLSYIKGWKLLIDAFSIFNKFKQNSLLYFVGEGEDKAKILKYIKSLHLDKQIILVGKVPQEKLALYLNASDIFVMGSFIEGWPTSMVEALACGKRIVTTNVGGAEEMVVNGSNGFIIKERDPNIFAKKCLEVLELKGAGEISLKMALKYSISTLRYDLVRVCNYDL